MRHKNALVVLTTSLVLAGCASTTSPRPNTSAPTSFNVTVKNVSTSTTLQTSEGPKPVPLSPGAYAVHTGQNPLFTPGQKADQGTENIAEDGFPMQELTELQGKANVKSAGIFKSPAGENAALMPGEVATFTITANRGDRLSFATMFVQSNDLFYSPDISGIALFGPDGTPVSGNVTEQLILWDAGTEVNQEPGVGPAQKPRQPRPNFGPDENQVVRRISEVNDGFTYPPTAQVIQVTITPRGQ